MNSWASVYLPPIDPSFVFPALSIRNTSSGACEVLPKQSIYRMYVCGITPYDATHMGHAATYLTFDMINRYLRATGAEVRFVQNITDVDDPLLERAKRDGVDWQDLAQSQIELFRGDMVDLHIIPPDHYIGVVEAIPLVVEAIEKLQEAGSVYQVDQDLYFDVHADSAFGSRSHLSNEKMLEIFAQRGGDPARSGKRDPLDALLWLAERAGEPTWASPFGNGRPGWHIECCAIALNYLQPDSDCEFALDIQGGGTDLIFPHHEMSAAQGRIMEGRDFARAYVHAGMIGLDGEKMSKSLGNLVLVSSLINEGADPMAIRLALLSHHYEADRMWRQSELDSASIFLDRLRLNLARMEVAPTSRVITAIIDSISENIDTPAALRHIEQWMVATESGEIGGSAGELSRAIDTLLGIAT